MEKPVRRDLLIVAVLGLNLVYLAVDLLDDIGLNQPLRHMALEIIAVIFNLLCIFWMAQKIKILKAKETKLVGMLGEAQIQSEEWHKKHQSLMQGFAKAVDAEMEKWKLSPAEKEVALLMLKGLTYKEIAQVRQITEQTIKQQSSAIYRKSGLESRSEVSAYFLEGVL